MCPNGRTMDNAPAPTTSSKKEGYLKQMRHEFYEQLQTSLPTIAGLVLYKIPWIISLSFVGRIGADELAAAALSTTLCNVTGLSLSVGLSSAITTLTGQSRGDMNARGARRRKQQNHEKSIKERELHFQQNAIEEQALLCNRSKEPASNFTATYQTIDSFESTASSRGEGPVTPLIYLYRGIFIQLIFVIPVGLWWLHGVKPMLLSLGQTEKLSTMTGIYLRILTPGLWSYSINWTLTAWLQSIEMADVPAYGAAVGLALHVPFNLLFIKVLGWGYLGAATATVMFQVVQPVLMLVYMFGTRRGRNRVLVGTGACTEDEVNNNVNTKTLSFCWGQEAVMAVSSFTGIWQYLELALPGIITISEWWASEITIFLSGRLMPYPAYALDGMTIYQSTLTFCFMFPVGCAVAGSARVGQFLGANDPDGADLAGKVSVLAATAVSVAMGCILFFSPHSMIPSILTNDEAVILETSRVIPLLSIYVVADGIQNAFNGIIKGCGRQCVTMPIVVIAYWLVGVPLAYYIAFVRHDGYMCDDNYFCGILGLVTGMTTGTWVHMLLLLFTVVCFVNYKVEAEKAQERLSSEELMDNFEYNTRRWPPSSP